MMGRSLASILKEALRYAYSQYKKGNAEKCIRHHKYGRSSESVNKDGQPVREYVICMTPRVGSTLLCYALHRLCCLGVPDEYYNPRLMPITLDSLNDRSIKTVADYAVALRRGYTSDNGVFAVKTTWDDFADFKDLFFVPQHNVSFIYLTRRDLVAQAVSIVAAHMSKVFHSFDKGAAAPGYADVFSKLRTDTGMWKVDAALNNIVRQNALWEQYFQLGNINPLRLYYEDVVADVPAAIEQIAAYVGIRAPRFTGDLPLAKLSGAHHEEYYSFYRDRFISRPDAWKNADCSDGIDLSRVCPGSGGWVDGWDTRDGKRQISGWSLIPWQGALQPPEHVVALYGDRPAETWALNLSRPDVLADNPGAASDLCGFSHATDTMRSITLYGATPDGGLVPIGIVPAMV
jgi:trehalose 2-sulfotransferase